ncbi:MAG TPA: hypothetical protein VKN36_00140 [Eudoraea sp.]|nr:hypothetical protein [Eudoraea sp.]
MKYITLLILLIAVGCKNQKNALDNTANAVEDSEELNLVLSDNYGGTETPELMVIREEAALNSFFSRINKTRKPGIPVPEVDFSKKMVLVYCSGKTTAGTVPNLYTTSETDDRMTVGIKNQQTEKDASSTAIVMPFGLYVMALTDKEVVLETHK